MKTGAKRNRHDSEKNKTPELSLADELFVAATLRYSNPEAEFLPKLTAARALAMAQYRKGIHTKAAANREPVKKLSGAAVFSRQSSRAWMLRAAVALVVVGAVFFIARPEVDDTIRIIDEKGKSALHNEFGSQKKPVSLRVMRKRKKIGEITVAQGSRIKLVEATDNDIFRSKMALTGGEADFRLKYKGTASVVVNNGPFTAKVRIAPEPGNDVHLKFRETDSVPDTLEPQFTIEVLKGHVQIAEVEDGDFESYQAGEQAVFSIEDESPRL